MSGRVVEGAKIFVYICKGVRRWAGAAGDLSLVIACKEGPFVEQEGRGYNLEVGKQYFGAIGNNVQKDWTEPNSHQSVDCEELARIFVPHCVKLDDDFSK